MLRSLFLLAAIVLLPVAVRAQTAPAHAGLPADSLVGSWSYAIETPDGNFNGQFVIAKADDGTLSAKMTGDAGTGEGLPVRSFAFDGHKMTGLFTNPQFGDISFDLTITGRTFSGGFTALAMGATVPASGRKL